MGSNPSSSSTVTPSALATTASFGSHLLVDAQGRGIAVVSIGSIGGTRSRRCVGTVVVVLVVVVRRCVGSTGWWLWIGLSRHGRRFLETTGLVIHRKTIR